MDTLFPNNDNYFDIILEDTLNQGVNYQVAQKYSLQVPFCFVKCKGTKYYFNYDLQKYTNAP